MICLRSSDNTEQILSIVDKARINFAEHLGISVDIMNHISSKGDVYWKFCVGNREKIEVRRATNSKNIEYVIKDKGLVFIRNKAEKIGFFQCIQNYLKDELVINDEGMDKLINYIQNNPKLKKKYF
jgi:hypothetical protein